MKFITLPSGVIVNLEQVAKVDFDSQGGEVTRAIDVTLPDGKHRFWNDDAAILLDALEDLGADVKELRERTDVGSQKQTSVTPVFIDQSGVRPSS